jgi:ATP/maltotriose-dependent transcriptional regulator MalT
MVTVPKPLTGVVERPRLHAILDRGTPVTLVCAPAGSGRTMLLAAVFLPARERSADASVTGRDAIEPAIA